MPKDIFRLAYNVRMEAENSDTAEVMLYGEIVEDGPKWWKWSEEDKSASDFDKAIKEVRKAGLKNCFFGSTAPEAYVHKVLPCAPSLPMQDLRKLIFGLRGYVQARPQI